MMSNNQVCVPTRAVEAYDGDNDTGVSPEVGDDVEVTLKGKVSRVEGGNVYFSPTEANGQPIGGQHGEEEPPPDEDADMDQFMAKAGAGGGGGGGSDQEEGGGY